MEYQPAEDMDPEKFLILIVDDEETMRRSMADLLKLEGYQTITAKDGLDAIEKITSRSKTYPQEPFDLILLDLKMPGINGMEVLRKVKKERPHVEVIILTGHGSEQDKELALEFGAFAYLEKPVDIEVLSKTKEELINK